MASHEMIFKNYQKQLKDSIKSIHENYMDILKTRTEHVNFEVEVKSAEIVRSYQALIQLVSEMRTFIIINDLGANEVEANNFYKNSDEKLIRLRDDIAMFLYELELK